MRYVYFVAFFMFLVVAGDKAQAAGFCDRYDCAGKADEVISWDSQRWFMNRFDRGSVKFDRVTFESPSGLKVKYKVKYTYNGGQQGWAELQVNDGEFVCITYHDFPNDCRASRKF